MITASYIRAHNERYGCRLPA